MRVALIGCTVNPRVGGMGRALYDHAMALAEAGHEVTVYTLDSIGPRRAVQGLRLLDPPVALQNDRITVGKLRRFFSIGKAAWAARFDPPLDAYDVVHLHLPFFGVAESIAGVPRVAHPKLFATYHMDAVGMGLQKWYFNWWYRHRFKKVLDACDAIAVTSRAYARDSQLARAGIDVEKCEEILLRVDTGVFNPVAAQGQATRVCEEGVPRAAGYFLFVGALDRAHYFKGVSVLLRALAETRDVKFVIVGKGESLKNYQKEAARFGISNRVHFTGGVSDEELAAWYAGARALVLPSTDRSEAFGIVLIEAMACGTPVIASDLPGVRAVVERVSGGALVPLGIASSPGASRNDNLIAALQQMWQHSWTANERAALAARAASVYGRATLADQLLQWYTTVHVSSR